MACDKYKFQANIMNTILLILFGALACLASGSPEKYVETPRDSLTNFANVLIVAPDSLLNEDSVYCDKIVLAGETEFKAKDARKASYFTCKDKRVLQFTFAGYEGPYVKLLYKPEGTDEPFFGKAKIRTDALQKVYVMHEPEVRKKNGSSKDGHGSRGTSMLSLLALVLVTGLFIYLIGR